MKVIKKISTISGYASGVLIALIWALMIAEVIMRNIFHHPILGCSEICVFMYVSASYFGFSFTQIYKGHITVDLLYTNLKPAGQRALDIISRCWSPFCSLPLLIAAGNPLRPPLPHAKFTWLP